LLNASVGVQRALDRLRPAADHRSEMAQTLHRHGGSLARGVRALVLPERHYDARPDRPHQSTAAAASPAAVPAAHVTPARAVTPSIARRTAARTGLVARSAPAAAHVVAPAARARLAHRSLVSRVGAGRAVPAAAVAILLVATAISSAPALAQPGSVGNTAGSGSEARIAVGGAPGAIGGPDGPITDSPYEGLGVIGAGANAIDGTNENDGPTGNDGATNPESADAIDATAFDDGTLLKPVAVDTTVTDGSGLMRSYKVRSGDTLTGIARKFGVSMMTVWWANHLRSKDDLHIGQTLTIPPVSGVVITVSSTDTLEALAAKYQIEPQEIIDANKLDDPNLVIGQTLTIPGGHGAGIPTPKPATPKPVAKASGGSSSGSHTSSKPPSQYSGGKFAWPVDGGYISQYFHYGHYALDIAADYGTRVKAAAAGTVIFAGWKNNGGGYQVWIAHGSNLYTTYNHMSSISVGRGQHVGRGQQVGRVGQTGNATGPHLHFEVWRGPIWNGGTRVNPLIYL
jgi:murein DD-endopeptidase MepM/ murein hydrolase activator NlpD